MTAPAGVGSLAQAIVHHFRSTRRAPSVAVVEPIAAPAVFTSLRAGRVTAVETGETIMMGLNCGTPSPLAWPVLRDGADVSVIVSEDETLAAMSSLERLGVDSGPCGAASLAGVRLLQRSAADAVALGPDSVIVLVNTESRAANPVEVRSTELVEATGESR